MLKTALLGACLIVSLAACAIPPPTKALASGALASPRTPALGCVADAPTRIPLKPTECEPGRTYTQADLQRTGALDTASALQQLDPSVTVHH